MGCSLSLGGGFIIVLFKSPGWFWGSEIRNFLWVVWRFGNLETSLGGFGVPKFGNFFGWFGGPETRKPLWMVWGFRNSETSLGGLGVPKFGNYFGWFEGSEIRKLLWVVWGFRNSETSLGGLGIPKFGNFFGWFGVSSIRRNNWKLRRRRNKLVGSFLLSQLQVNINVVFYRDDGLAITNATLRDTENIKKEICRMFNNNGLRITIEAKKQIINFLDVTFNLNRSTYQPFTKPNTSLQYVHRESNHPPITTKKIPASINKRLSSLSSDKASFDQAAPPNQKALDESGYHYTLQYEPAKASKRKNRQRNNILWYNPPFSKNT